MYTDAAQFAEHCQMLSTRNLQT